VDEVSQGRGGHENRPACLAQGVVDGGKGTFNRTVPRRRKKEEKKKKGELITVHLYPFTQKEGRTQTTPQSDVLAFGMGGRREDGDPALQHRGEREQKKKRGSPLLESLGAKGRSNKIYSGIAHPEEGGRRPRSTGVKPKGVNGSLFREGEKGSREEMVSDLLLRGKERRPPARKKGGRKAVLYQRKKKGTVRETLIHTSYTF